MKKHIYPEIDIKEISIHRSFLEDDGSIISKPYVIIELRTTIRFEHEGKWYYNDFFRTGEYSVEKSHDALIGLVRELIREVYFHMILNEGPVSFTRYDGSVINPECEKQISEKERLEIDYPFIKPKKDES